MGNILMKKFYCIDCNIKISYGRKRCRPCYEESRKLPEFNCIDCGCKISRKETKRCVKCNGKIIRGKYHPQWKGGWKNNLPKCLDCDKILSKNECKRCHSCENKRKWKIGLYNHIGKKGSDNPNWQGGISKLPYPFEFNYELKEVIRIRDNHTCQLCDMGEVEHLILFGKKQFIHHIDYNKQNCKKENLITLCNYCHSRTNHNRDYWIEFFKQKMEVNL
jgi:hypothetical protein